MTTDLPKYLKELVERKKKGGDDPDISERTQHEEFLGELYDAFPKIICDIYILNEEKEQLQKYKDHNYTLLSVLKEKDKYIEILEKERAWSKVAREALEEITKPTKMGEHGAPWFYRKGIAVEALKKQEEILQSSTSGEAFEDD